MIVVLGLFYGVILWWGKRELEVKNLLVLLLKFFCFWVVCICLLLFFIFIFNFNCIFYFLVLDLVKFWVYILVNE